MFSFLKPRGKNPVLDALIAEIENNASNNYKDAAQDSLKKFIAAFDDLKCSKALTEKQLAYYEERLSDFQKDMKKFTHADQKATWN